MSTWVDRASFGLVNLLHARHPLPPDFADKLQAYISKWENTSAQDYYSVSVEDEARAALSFDAARGGGVVSWQSPHLSGFTENDQAYFQMFPSAKGWSAPTMLLSHGLMSTSEIGYQLWAKALNKRGWNAIVVHLPYHFSRRPRGYLTGELAIGGDLIRVAEGVRQAVKELRVVLAWLEKQGSSLRGAWGTSYGGWISAVLACIDDRINRLILVEPVVDIQEAIWTSPLCSGLRKRLRQRGVGPEFSAPHMRLCCPLQALPRTQGKHVLMLAGAYDLVATPEQVSRLHESWKGSHYYVFPQGHVGYRLMPESWRLALQLWPEDFAAASR